MCAAPAPALNPAQNFQLVTTVTHVSERVLKGLVNHYCPRLTAARQYTRNSSKCFSRHKVQGPVRNFSQPRTKICFRSQQLAANPLLALYFAECEGSFYRKYADQIVEQLNMYYISTSLLESASSL